MASEDAISVRSTKKRKKNSGVFRETLAFYEKKTSLTMIFSIHRTSSLDQLNMSALISKPVFLKTFGKKQFSSMPISRRS